MLSFLSEPTLCCAPLVGCFSPEPHPAVKDAMSRIPSDAYWGSWLDRWLWRSGACLTAPHSAWLCAGLRAHYTCEEEWQEPVMAHALVFGSKGGTVILHVHTPRRLCSQPRLHLALAGLCPLEPIPPATSKDTEYDVPTRRSHVLGDGCPSMEQTEQTRSFALGFSLCL